MLKRFFSDGFQVVRGHSGATASASPIATFDDLLSASVGFDLEIIDDAKGPARLRDAAAFPANAEPDEAANSCGLSAAKIEAELRSHRFAIGHNAAIHDLPELEALTGRSFDDLQLVDTIWLSPHDELDSPPCDAAPDELAVATAIDRLQSVVDWRIEALERKWAGLRTFAPDRVPVFGWDARQPGFFWYAGQGGTGIQTQPAAAALARALFFKETPTGTVASIDPAPYDPARFGS